MNAKNNKKALLIGSKGTIGSALVDEMESQYQLYTLSREDCDYSETSLQQKAKELESEGPFSLIICCVGVLHNETVRPEKMLGQLNEMQLSEYFRINTIIPSLCLRFFQTLLDKSQTSQFTFLSAMVGSIEDNRLGGWYGYRSSKAALNMMIKTASVEMKRLNKMASLAVIHPGTTIGPLSKPFAGGVSKDKYYTAQQSAKRILSLSESLTPQQTGSFFNWDGSHLPW